MEELHQSFDNPKYYRKQEYQDGNLVDAVHHTQVEIAFLAGIRFLENPEEVISYCTQLKELLKSIF